MFDILMGIPEMKALWDDLTRRKQITIIGLEPHPEDSKSGAYGRVSLSDLPKR